MPSQCQHNSDSDTTKPLLDQAIVIKKGHEGGRYDGEVVCMLPVDF